MHIFIDFDYTLFDTQAMRLALSAALSDFGVTAAEFKAAENRVTASGALYSLQAHMHELADSGVDVATLQQAAEEVLQDTSRFLYSDAAAFMQRHEGVPLTILSFGNEEWQRVKIEHSGLLRDGVDIQPTSLPKVQYIQEWAAGQGARINEQTAVFINDRGNEIDALHNAVEGVVSIWVRRPGTPYEQEPCASATYTVTDLSFDLQTLIN